MLFLMLAFVREIFLFALTPKLQMQTMKTFCEGFLDWDGRTLKIPKPRFDTYCALLFFHKWISSFLVRSLRHDPTALSASDS
jgi:hypothetical protein